MRITINPMLSPQAAKTLMVDVALLDIQTIPVLIPQAASRFPAENTGYILARNMPGLKTRMPDAMTALITMAMVI